MRRFRTVFALTPTPATTASSPLAPNPPAAGDNAAAAAAAAISTTSSRFRHDTDLYARLYALEQEQHECMQLVEQTRVMLDILITEVRAVRAPLHAPSACMIPVEPSGEMTSRPGDMTP